MTTPDLENVVPPFDAWLSSDVVSCLPPEPVNYHQTVLEMPKIDGVRNLAAKTYRGADFTVSMPSVEIETLIAERRTWTRPAMGRTPEHAPAKSLKAKFSRWGKRKQESLIQNIATFQANSFAIENVFLSEEAVREKTTKLFNEESK